MVEAHFDLAIVGGGPAGQAAAEVAIGAGLSVAMIDEQPRPGGQILRQPPAPFTVARWMDDRVYRAVKAQLVRFEGLSGIDWLGGLSVIGIDPAASKGFMLQLAGAAGARRITATRVLIAAGCYDLPVPVAGWTLPGVMSAGGVQAFIKSQQIVPGRRFLIAGTHPLMLVVAAQIVKAGGTVAAVTFDQPAGAAITPLLTHPLASLRSVGALIAGAQARVALARAGVPVHFGRSLVRIEGGAKVERAVLRGPAGEDAVPCDTVALCYGFIPQSDLPRMAGAACTWTPRTGGWATTHDAWMRSSVAHLSVAGETTGIGGAAVSLAEGRLAGLGIARDAGALAAPKADALAAPVRTRLARLRAFAELLATIADPTRALARPIPGDTILCRCEDVTRTTIAAAMDQGAAPNAVKLLTRTGMGLCQGRTCEAALLRMIAARTGTEAGAHGGFTSRFPARPTRIGDLID